MVGGACDLAAHSDVHRPTLSSSIQRCPSGILQSQPVPPSWSRFLPPCRCIFQNLPIVRLWQFHVDVARIRVPPILVPRRLLLAGSSQVLDDPLFIAWHSSLYAHG